ncbi:hypothetical protein ROSINTL182_07175 [Roseburia intestinalis L1-82]|uniref:Uncharacterized protein n=1 Tax=Roseburia intestinalis L1-82 TaxID=536231 RepID=C7GB91_9FIRM|nr:hypothetical protein ROSINTL182_07175 [Roseburia intestinalis L1-82]
MGAVFFLWKKEGDRVDVGIFLQQPKTAVIRTADAPAAGIPSQRAWVDV